MDLWFLPAPVFFIKFPLRNVHFDPQLKSHDHLQMDSIYTVAIQPGFEVCTDEKRVQMQTSLLRQRNAN